MAFHVRHPIERAIVSLALLLIALSAAKAQSVSPYDLGYAYQASQVCPGLVLTVPVPEDAKTSSAFSDGVAMVQSNLERLTPERTCVFAMNLYDAENGKAAKILKRQ
jgi:hypothetical protein